MEGVNPPWQNAAGAPAVTHSTRGAPARAAPTRRANGAGARCIRRAVRAPCARIQTTRASQAKVVAARRAPPANTTANGHRNGGAIEAHVPGNRQLASQLPHARTRSVAPAIRTVYRFT